MSTWGRTARPRITNLPLAGNPAVKILEEARERIGLVLYNDGTGIVYLTDDPAETDTNLMFPIPAGGSMSPGNAPVVPHNALFAVGDTGHSLRIWELVTVRDTASHAPLAPPRKKPWSILRAVLVMALGLAAVADAQILIPPSTGAVGGLTDAQLRASPVPVSGPLTDAQLRASAVPVSGTVTATGPLTDAQLRASAVPVSGTVIANAGTGTFNVGLPNEDQQTRANSISVVLASNQIVCSSRAAVSQTADTQVITGSASNFIYICSIALVAAAAETINIIEGTGVTCATSPAALYGSTTEASGLALAANGGFTQASAAPFIRTQTAATNLCITQVGAGRIAGAISYVVAP